jgi:hypothetical protein
MSVQPDETVSDCGGVTVTRHPSPHPWLAATWIVRINGQWFSTENSQFRAEKAVTRILRRRLTPPEY